MAFMLIFMVADLTLLPEKLHSAYLISRLGMQLPIILILLALSFSPFFERLYHRILCVSALGITFSNYWLTIQCWLLGEFYFPYEGALLYALFVIIVMRLTFNYAFIYFVLSVLGFALMETIYPIYAELAHVNLGFLVFGFATFLIGAKRTEQTFKKLKEANDKLTTLSQIDQLSGIYNRGTFEAKFYDMLGFAKRTHTRVCVYA